MYTTWAAICMHRPASALKVVGGSMLAAMPASSYQKTQTLRCMPSWVAVPADPRPSTVTAEALLILSMVMARPGSTLPLVGISGFQGPARLAASVAAMHGAILELTWQTSAWRWESWGAKSAVKS